GRLVDLLRVAAGLEAVVPARVVAARVPGGGAGLVAVVEARVAAEGGARRRAVGASVAVARARGPALREALIEAARVGEVVAVGPADRVAEVVAVDLAVRDGEREPRRVAVLPVLRVEPLGRRRPVVVAELRVGVIPAMEGRLAPRPRGGDPQGDQPGSHALHVKKIRPGALFVSTTSPRARTPRERPQSLASR